MSPEPAATTEVLFSRNCILGLIFGKSTLGEKPPEAKMPANGCRHFCVVSVSVMHTKESTRSGRMQMKIDLLNKIRHGFVWSLAALFVLSTMAGSAAAQFENFEDPLGVKHAARNAEKPQFTATLNPTSAKPGDEVTLTVSVKLPPKHYIYAIGPAEPRTQITINKSVGLEAIDNDFKPDREPETKFDPDLQQRLSKFHGQVSWTKKYRVEQSATPDKVAIDLQLEGQYCSEGPGGTCKPIRPPAEMPATLDIDAVKAQAQDQVAADGGNAVKPDQKPDVASGSSEPARTGRFVGKQNPGGGIAL